MSILKRPHAQYPLDLCDRETCLRGVLKIKRQFLYITIRDRQKPWWALRYEVNRQAKRIHEIVKELYQKTLD